TIIRVRVETFGTVRALLKFRGHLFVRRFIEIVLVDDEVSQSRAVSFRSKDGRPFVVDLCSQLGAVRDTLDVRIGGRFELFHDHFEPVLGWGIRIVKKDGANDGYFLDIPNLFGHF
ncbi:MAG: hypothetical protein JNL74_06450, partial [Fibrobacteres bacterium]|nr:hypothetical protein [Fibrobacterota bacterium]